MVNSSGTATAAVLAFGGYNRFIVSNLVESWNGSSWTETTRLRQLEQEQQELELPQQV